MKQTVEEAAKQYAEIETKNVLNVRATAERSFIAGAESAFDVIISKLGQKLDAVLEAETTESLMDWIAERKIKLLSSLVGEKSINK